MADNECNSEYKKLKQLEIEAMIAGAEFIGSYLMLQSTDYPPLDSYLNDVEWSKQHRHTVIYNEFLDQLELVQLSKVQIRHDGIYLKMRFSYAVTLMESCLSEMIKSVTMQYDTFRRNAITEINDLKNLKIPAQVLLDKNPKDILDNAIMAHLSHVLYHNMDKVSKLYADILGEEFPSINNDENKKIRNLMALRHDIVHRNGKDINGETIDIDSHMVHSCIEDIRLFVEDVHKYIVRNVEKLSEKNV